MENFLPYVTRKVFSEARKITNKDDEDVSVYDRKEEKSYLERVREESDLPEYDIYTDYAEMVVQVIIHLVGLIVVWVRCALVCHMANYAAMCSSQ